MSKPTKTTDKSTKKGTKGIAKADTQKPKKIPSTLTAKEGQKQYILKTVVKENELFHAMDLATYMLPAFALITAVLLLCFGYRVDGWFSIDATNSAAEKNHWAIWLLSGGVVAIGCILSLILHFLVKYLAGQCITDRAGEKISVNNKELCLSYHMPGGPSNAKTIIRLPLGAGQVIAYNPATRKLTFFMFRGTHAADDTAEDKLLAAQKAEGKNFVIYDYFGPSLFDTLKQLKANIVEETTGNEK